MFLRLRERVRQYRGWIISIACLLTIFLVFYVDTLRKENKQLEQQVQRLSTLLEAQKAPPTFVAPNTSSQEGAKPKTPRKEGKPQKSTIHARPVTEKSKISRTQTPEYTFLDLGLTETKRRSIFAEIVKAEDKAWKDAEAEYPILKASAPGFSNFKDKLKDKYKGELATKHGLTLEQLKKIGTEGLVENWPLPKYNP